MAKKMKKDTDRTKQPSRLEVIRTTTAQVFAHRATSDVERERDMHLFRSSTLETEASAIQVRLSEIKNSRAEIDSCVAGLNDVIAAR